MADRFTSWDRFQANRLLTQDSRKAATWTRYEQWAEQRRLENFRRQADMLALASQLKKPGVP